jgi:hypothetical protein
MLNSDAHHSTLNENELCICVVELPKNNPEQDNRRQPRYSFLCQRSNGGSVRFPLSDKVQFVAALRQAKVIGHQN